MPLFPATFYPVRKENRPWNWRFHYMSKFVNEIQKPK